MVRRGYYLSSEKWAGDQQNVSHPMLELLPTAPSRRLCGQTDCRVPRDGNFIS